MKHIPLVAMPLMLLLAACSPQDTTAPADTAAHAEAPAAVDAASVEPAASEEGPVTRFRAMGNEPFWSVAVDGTQLRYSTPDNPDGIVLEATRSAYAKGVEFMGEHAGKPFNLNIRGEACPDTMADTTHEFTAVFDFDGQTLRGCAERAD